MSETCDFCGTYVETKTIKRVDHEWHELPAGWLRRFVTVDYDHTEELLVCSKDCADRYDAREQEQRRMAEIEAREEWARMTPEERARHQQIADSIYYTKEHAEQAAKTFQGMEPRLRSVAEHNEVAARYLERRANEVINPPLVVAPPRDPGPANPPKGWKPMNVAVGEILADSRSLLGREIDRQNEALDYEVPRHLQSSFKGKPKP